MEYEHFETVCILPSRSEQPCVFYVNIIMYNFFILLNVINSLQLDNHGNHLLLTDESAINVPAIAAGHVIKRYNAQSSDEISLEVGGVKAFFFL